MSVKTNPVGTDATAGGNPWAIGAPPPSCAQCGPFPRENVHDWGSDGAAARAETALAQQVWRLRHEQHLAEALRLAVGDASALIGWEEAARLLGCKVDTLKKRVERGQYRDAIHNARRGAKKSVGKKGGNKGRVMFVRGRLIETLRGGR